MYSYILEIDGVYSHTLGMGCTLLEMGCTLIVHTVHVDVFTDKIDYAFMEPKTKLPFCTELSLFNVVKCMIYSRYYQGILSGDIIRERVGRMATVSAWHEDLRQPRYVCRPVYFLIRTGGA